MKVLRQGSWLRRLNGLQAQHFLLQRLAGLQLSPLTYSLGGVPGMQLRSCSSLPIA